MSLLCQIIGHDWVLARSKHKVQQRIDVMTGLFIEQHECRRCGAEKIEAELTGHKIEEAET